MSSKPTEKEPYPENKTAMGPLTFALTNARYFLIMDNNNKIVMLKLNFNKEIH